MGAWIEISMNRTRPKQIVVAPLVGAWIEIEVSQYDILWVIVAPLVGAWIEILFPRKPENVDTSLLSWERGLKCYPNATTYTAGMSLLSWERGLK